MFLTGNFFSRHKIVELLSASVFSVGLRSAGGGDVGIESKYSNIL